MVAFSERTGIQARGKSRRLERVLCDFGSEQSFAGAASRVLEHYGFEPNVSAVRLITLRHAQRAVEKTAVRDAATFRSLPAEGAKHLVAEADGTMICTVAAGPKKGKRPRLWKEMRLVAAQAPDSLKRSYGAGFCTVEQIGRSWGHCAREVGWGLNTQIHVVADGAEWIQKQSQETFGGQQTFLLDYFHVSQYLAEAAMGCRPQHPAQWRKVQQKRLLRGASPLVLEELAAHLEAPEVPDENAPVQAAHRYLTNRLDALDYPRALRLELPVGSGLIESGNRHLLQRRLKQPGTVWLQESAHAIAQLRVLRANGLWNDLWN